MKLIKRKIYKKQAFRVNKVKHTISVEEEDYIRVCSNCGRQIPGTFYYCPRCRKHFGFQCVIHTIGGNACPQCNEFTFLKIVEVKNYYC